MNIKDLELKVEKANEKVEKCKKTIERHEKQLDKKLSPLGKKGINLSNLEQFKRDETGKGSEHYWEITEVEWKLRDIEGAKKKLTDAEIVLENWKTKLNTELEKERFLEGNVPQVIKDFLEKWKEIAFDWYVKRYDEYQVFKENLIEEEYQARVECIKSNPEYSKYLDETGEIKNIYQNNLENVFPRKPMEEYLKERNLDWRSIESRKSTFAGSTVLYMCGIYDKIERLEWLDKELENEKKAKMLDLINRINKVVGTIIDASNLRVSEKGNLDGIVVGEKGKAKVETIGAGGFAVQVFHYRTLVHKIK